MSYMIGTTSKMYIANTDQNYEMIFFKKLPIDNIQKLELRSCMCFSNRSMTSTECQNTVRTKMTERLMEIYIKQAKLFDTEPKRIQKRQAEWILNSLGLIGMGYWNHKQDNRIKNLENMEIENSNNIAILGEEVKNNKKAILLAHKTNVKNFKRIDREICRWGEKSRIEAINFAMEEILHDYLMETEEEIYALRNEQLPNRQQFQNAFEGVCRATESALPNDEQEYFCKQFSEGIPIEYEPGLYKLSYNEDGIYIHARYTMPVIEESAFALGRIYNNGIITKAKTNYVKKQLQLERYAILAENSTYEIDIQECKSNNHISICNSNSIWPDNCLTNPDECRINYRRTTKSCTYLHTPRSTIIYDIGYMEISVMDSFSHVKQDITRRTGSVIVKHGEHKQLVVCSDLKSRIIIPHTRSWKTKKITIKRIRLETAWNNTQELMTDTTEIGRIVNYNGTKDVLEAMRDTARKHVASLQVSNWKDWLLLVMTGIILLFIGIAVIMWINRAKIGKATGCLENAVQIELPTGFAELMG